MFLFCPTVVYFQYFSSDFCEVKWHKHKVQKTGRLMSALGDIHSMLKSFVITCQFSLFISHVHVFCISHVIGFT